MPDSIVEQAATLLRSGGVVALPTETVYGLAADATNVAALERVFAIKRRPSNHPLIVHLASSADIDRYATRIGASLHRLAECFWPGPLTLIVHKTKFVPDTVTGGQPTVALRVPAHPIAHAVIETFGRAIAAPSANRFGRVSPTTAQHVRDDLGDEVDLIVDGGAALFGVESTIVDLTGDVPAILRAGVIGATALSEVLGQAITTRAGGAVRTPGMLDSHYAPRAPLVLVAQADLQREIDKRSARGAGVGVLTLPTDARAAAHALYESLRTLDATGYDVLLATLPVDIEANAAVRDRLLRAASTQR